METKKNDHEKLENKLFFKKKSGWVGVKSNKLKEIFDISDDYKNFLNVSKTERECISEIERLALKNGYKRLKDATKLTKKIILNYDGVAGALVHINDIKNFNKGFVMNGAHIDSPRLDLKQFPLYEDLEMAYMKTHYYGGVKKYQWMTRPLALHGIVCLENGKSVKVVIGEKESDSVFVINDLLPHLAKDQMNKNADKFIEGEQLNILVGSIPYKFKDKKNAIKLNILDYIYKQYGFKEEDFVSAELQLVPAGSARDVGFDKSFVGAHGQDDRVCAYLGMRALFDVDSLRLKKNLMMVFFDKEEIGSVGNTGAASNLIERMVNEVLKLHGNKSHSLLIESLENSKFLSSDVNAGIDPEWKSVNEPMNAAKIGSGVCLTKFTGSRGKSGSNEAHAEFTAKVRRAFNKDEVLWQTTELGKVDQGGGGTVAMHLAYFGMDVIDCGTPLLSMHAPFEVASKVDIFNTYKAYKAFYKYL